MLSSKGWPTVKGLREVVNMTLINVVGGKLEQCNLIIDFACVQSPDTEDNGLLSPISLSLLGSEMSAFYIFSV